MKSFAVACLIVAVVVWSARSQDTNNPAFPGTITIDDFTYENVQWGKTAPCVMILHKGGTAYIPLAKLPAEIRDQLLTAREVKPTVTPAATIPTTPASTNIVEAAPAQLSLPVLGDETSIAEVISDPAKWQDKWFVASGVTKTNSIFLYGSAFSPDTHYSLRFEPVTADAKSGNILTVYAKREAAGPLVAAIAKSQPDGKPMPVRLKIKITAHCFLFGKYQEMAELVDWQLLKDDRASWADWALGAK